MSRAVDGTMHKECCSLRVQARREVICKPRKHPNLQVRRDIAWKYRQTNVTANFEQRCLSRDQAAAYCGCDSLSTFADWIRKGIIPGPIPGTRRWDRRANGDRRGCCGDVFEATQQARLVVLDLDDQVIAGLAGDFEGFFGSAWRRA